MLANSIGLKRRLSTERSGRKTSTMHLASIRQFVSLLPWFLTVSAAFAQSAVSPVTNQLGVLYPLPGENAVLLVTTLTPDDPRAGHLFGWSVAMADGCVVVSAPGDDDAGAAYVFVRRAVGQWEQDAKLSAADATTGSGFGQSVATDGHWIAVGAPRQEATGAVYLFAATNQSYIQVTKLVPPVDPPVVGFGQSVAMADDTLVVGAAGVVFVYQRDVGGAWQPQSELVPHDPSETSEFGFVVALSGDRIVVGAPVGEAAYVFRREADTWVQQGKLVASNPVMWDRFGRSVGIHRDTILVAAPFGGSGFPRLDPGVLYLFREKDGTWIEGGRIRDGYGSSGGWLGFSTAICADNIVTGAPSPTSGSGGLYVYAWDGTNVTGGARIEMLSATGHDHFGFSAAAAAPGQLVGGAPHHGQVCNPPSDQCTLGAAFVYEKLPAHDLAVVSLRAPKRVALKANRPPPTKQVVVKLQNRSFYSVTIPDLAALERLVQLEATAINSNCAASASFVLARGRQHKLPRVLEPGRQMNVVFEAVFPCAGAPLKGVGHEDYRLTARVDLRALDGEIDTHPECDVCPRSPVPAATDSSPDDPWPDQGCGNRTADRGRGADVLVDVVVE